ncbi:hypothetical protein MMC07_009399 [Pseudocyphellaria aurata]|nr:hypothetical protein [Pseudocyphellaria aurata]
MLALQNISSPKDTDTSLSNITNNSSAMVRNPQTFDAISSQILSLTSIATNLQREMAQLSRRSKDNATDLISLKEATNLRDEDIRTSLRELVSNLSSNLSSQMIEPAGDNCSRATSHYSRGTANFMLDSKPHVSPSGMPKSFSLPRIPSPNSFAALDREVVGSPYNMEGAASIALLEKVLREMGTKEAQERLVASLSELHDRSKSKDSDPAVAKKLEEILTFLKEGSNGKVLVARGDSGNGTGDGPPKLELEFEPRSMSLARISRESAPPSGLDISADGRSAASGGFLSDEMPKTLKKIKDSIIEGGGMTAELKALVRELRGEVLGMGREIGRKLDQAESTQDAHGPGREEIVDAIKDGLENLKINITRDDDGDVAGEALRTVKEELEHLHDDGDVAGEALLTVKQELEHLRETLITTIVHGNSSDDKEELKALVRELRGEVLGMGHEIERKLDQAESTQDAHVPGREEIIDAIKDGLENLKINISRDDDGDASGEALLTVKEELEHLRETLTTTIVRGNSSADKEELIEALREGLETVRADISRSHDTPESIISNTGEILDALNDGLDGLRVDVERMFNKPLDMTVNYEILDTLKEGLTNIRSEFDRFRSSDQENIGSKGGEVVIADGEVETLRRNDIENLEVMITELRIKVESMDNVTQPPPAAPLAPSIVVKEDLEGIEVLLRDVQATVAELSQREQKERKDTVTKDDTEAIETLLRGTEAKIDDLLSAESERVDVEKMLNKPLDMTVNYEILDTLKEGLTNIRSEFDRLRSSDQEIIGSSKGGEVVIADGEVEVLRRNDIENLEVMITQLRIKVESMDNVPQPPPAASAAPSAPPNTEEVVVKEDLEEIEVLLRDVQATVTELSQREQKEREDTVTKDDTEAIETLLRNTKAKIDDMLSTEPESVARVVQVEIVEAVIKETLDAVNEFGRDSASKEDVGILEAQLKEVCAGVEDIRETVLNDNNGDRVHKSDIEVLENLCMDTKSHIEELVLPDVETLPTKVEIEVLGDLFRGFSGRREEDAELTARAFEARKIEHGGIADKIQDVKLFLDDVRGELKAKLDEDSYSIQELAKTLETFTETVVGTDAIPLVNELKETVSREFEAIHGAFAGSELEREQKHNNLLEKHDEHKAAIITELHSKIDERFDEIMTKYDDAQIAAGEKEKSFQEMSLQQIESLNSTNSITEDLRTLVDTLGSTVTDSCDRMGEDSKTVFERIEVIGSKLEGLLAADFKSEHQSTRTEISKTLTGVEGVQAHVSEYQPKILEAVKEILGLVGQHYEQAKTSAEEIKTSVKAIPAAIPLPAITAPPPTPPIPIEFPVHDKYDDSAVHAKLDRLVDHAAQTGKSLAQFALLDQIRDQVTTTANELSTFVAQHQASIAQAVDSRAKEAEEVAVALQMKISQKENVEAEIVRMSVQKDELNNEVQELIHDKEDLVAQKSKLQTDLSSLQTALQIRREELQIMENRAEGLERRILDSVLDHSRSLLTTSRPPSSLKEMNLKRVVSTASNTTTATRASTVSPTVPSYTSSAVSSGIGIALKRRQPTKSAVSSGISGKGDRRILSLSTLSGNKGPNADRSMVLANSAIAENPAKVSALGISGIKRSHSVKSNFPVRKTSWGGTKALGMYADEGIDDEDDKENSVLDEEDDDIDGVGGSEAGTERRTSYSGTYTGTMSYGDGSVVSADDRRTSYALSTVGTLGTKDIIPTEDGSEDSDSGSIDEEGEAEDSDLVLEGRGRDDGVHMDALAPKGGISNASEMVVFGQASDSGIGTEMPTAALKEGTDYFGRGE